MWLIKFIWRVIWNIKITLRTIIFDFPSAEHRSFCRWLTLLHVNNGLEALTGIHIMASKNEAEIAELCEEVFIERKVNREI